jgi:phosphatidate cytidylyltransferase
VNLILRVASALLLLPLALWGFHVGGDVTRALLTAVCAICLFEYTTIVSPTDAPPRWLTLVAGTLAMVGGTYATSATSALLLAQLPAILLAGFFTLRPGDIATSWNRMSALAFGSVYIGFPLAAVFQLRALGDALPPVSQSGFLVVTLAATWANDTCAYFAGRAFGRHKMYEKISPKKTWEGFAGGAIGTVLVLFLMRWGLGTSVNVLPVFADIGVVDVLFIGLPAAILAPLGDLAESMLKRSFGVKDSGKILPGHGGLLDRIDAVLFMAPWVLAYLSVVRPLLRG